MLAYNIKLNEITVLIIASKQTENENWHISGWKWKLIDLYKKSKYK